MSKLVTLEQAVSAIVAQHGGIRPASRATGIDKAFISRLMRGLKVNPSEETLKALGLRSVPLYEVIEAARRTDPRDAVIQQARDALVGLLRRNPVDTCQHWSTHRAGARRGNALWEVCDSCGARLGYWNSKPELVDPKELERVRAAIAAIAAIDALEVKP